MRMEIGMSGKGLGRLCLCFMRVVDEEDLEGGLRG